MFHFFPFHLMYNSGAIRCYNITLCLNTDTISKLTGSRVSYFHNRGGGGDT